ncbi:MAG: hypothetical protein OXR72_04125 [Gemmatimonadota bacterium]|nr:hypothetical protein [Gemmatimonadota bacterium]
MGEAKFEGRMPSLRMVVDRVALVADVVISGYYELLRLPLKGGVIAT